MKISTFAPFTAVGLMLSLVTVPAAEPPKPLEPVPSANQLAWIGNELTLFTHFGMNTFTGRGTGLGDEDPRLFNPAKLDCNQWVRVAKESGFQGIILTAKHHDGFCLWPTATTQHSVAASDWKGGKGDVVRELADACKAGGVRLGIYCSPWDRSVTNYDSDKPAYAKYYHQQLTELLSNYGPVFEMWFDGNKANVADWGNIIDVVRTLQPAATIKQGPVVKPVREDVQWVGNELACAPLENWSVFPRAGLDGRGPGHLVSPRVRHDDERPLVLGHERAARPGDAAELLLHERRAQLDAHPKRRAQPGRFVFG